MTPTKHARRATPLTAHSSKRWTRVTTSGVSVAIVAAALSGPMAPVQAAAGARGADLQVTRATVSKTTIAEGAKVKVTHVVKNRGKGAAAASETRFYLSSNVKQSLAERKTSRTNPRSAPQDVLLTGGRTVKKISAGKQVSLKQVTVTVPVGTAAGSYTVLACADDRGVVKEKNEANNCTPAATKLKVATAPGSDTLDLRSFADTYRWPKDESSTLQWMKIFCNSATPVKAMTLGAAITSTRNHLTGLAGANALAKLDQSGQADTAIKAQRLAAVAVAQNSPGLALAALLKAHDLEPKDGGHLINAAALATSIGLPNEGIAFLDAAQRLDLRYPAMGISQHAIALSVRGQAMLMTGRRSAAKGLFAAAERAEPLLSEADAGLANVAACDGNDAVAARYARASRQRSDEPGTTDPTKEIVRPEPEIDISQGKATPLRQLPIAETSAQGVVMHEVYKGIAEGFFAEIDAHNAEENAIDAHLNATDDLRTWAEKARRDSLLVQIYRVDDDPAIAALWTKVDKLQDRLLERREEFFGGGTGEAPYTYNTLAETAGDVCAGSTDPNCWIKEMNATCRPALTSAHIDYRTQLLALQHASDAYMAAASKKMSGYAANLIDEEANRKALLTIEGMETSVYSGIVGAASAWTHYEKLFATECVTPLPAEILDPPDAEDAASKGACPPALKAMNAVLPLGPTTIKANCEQVQVGISADVLPLVQIFSDVTYDVRTGGMTIVAGGNLGGKVGGVVGAGFKSGLYLTLDAQGDVKDVGWRVGPSATVGAGPVEMSVFNDEMDLSFLPSPTK